MEIVVDNFENEILFNKEALIREQCNKILILSGYIDIERIKKHVIKLKDGIEDGRYPKGISVEIIVGMTKGNSLSHSKCEKLKENISILNDCRGMPKVKCYVVNKNQEVHSKLYIWMNKKNPVCAFIGSLNYTINAFEKRRESVALCDAKSAYEYYCSIKKDAVDIFSYSSSYVENEGNVSFEGEEVYDSLWSDYDKQVPIDILTLSLLQFGGKEVGHGSGINWGHRQNGTKRNLDQAYIPYPAPKRKRTKGFFPDKKEDGEKNYPLFRVLLENEEIPCYMRLAQQDTKGIQTAESNALLGYWIRKEIGVPSGTFIKKEMLVSSGKLYARFEKYIDNTYRLKLVNTDANN